eukprot:TRINITY_DN26099_c0_g1_i1.p1 TRINITY_DN26099_c0_g1~~TRINITY_DN26099_c0_g1_i1.p1  ORF type:complete len:355 (-),score=95.54 TRINITY_DN26099_c0_g1_i1:219-1283(-)
MLAQLQTRRNQLRPVQELDPRMRPADAEQERPIICEELDEAEQQRIRQDFFGAGIERWLPLVADYSFATTSLPLSIDDCRALSLGVTGCSAASRVAIEEKVDRAMAELGWKQAFVKLSTRSPKDAPQILAKAAEQFHAKKGLEMRLADRVRLFAELVQQQFSVSSGREAVELLLSSERVREDLCYALECPAYDELGLHLVLRRWDGALPIASEFRGIVWDGHMNALGQYYHPLVFPEMMEQREEIAKDIAAVYEGLKPKLQQAGFSHCIIDFAWLGPQQVKIIELNPFDGVALGCFPGSTGLFRWDDEGDRSLIKGGPFELRMRTEPLSDMDLKIKLNTSWRDIVSPPGMPGRR